MGDIELVVPTASVMGYVAAFVRVGAFFLAVPFLGRRLGAVGRVAISSSLALVMFEPIDPPDLGGLLAIAATNLAVGLLLGFAIGIVFQAFLGAGSVVDTLAGLSIGAQFDPVTGTTAAVFDRFFELTALVVFLAVGGDRFLVSGLAATLDVVALDGGIDIGPRLTDVVTGQLTLLMLGVVQIAAPALVALFATELILGLAARMMPQVNLFVVGLPARLIVGTLAAATIVATMPAMVAWFLDHAEDLFVTLLSGVRPT